MHNLGLSKVCELIIKIAHNFVEIKINILFSSIRNMIFSIAIQLHAIRLNIKLNNREYRGEHELLLMCQRAQGSQFTYFIIIIYFPNIWV